MYFEFSIKIELERIEGKFAGKEELAELIQDELSNSNPEQIDGENGGQYQVVMFEVDRVK